MPRNGTHFVAKFFEEYCKKTNLDYWIQFRTFRNFKTDDERVLAFSDSLKKNSLIRITCDEETDNIKRQFGLENFFSKYTNIIVYPRKDLVDLLLARLLPYYHWSMTEFDGLPTVENYHSFYNRPSTWSPYFPEDVNNIVKYYKNNMLPFDKDKINKILEIIYDFFVWFNTHVKLIKQFSYVEFYLDDLDIFTKNTLVEYPEDFVLTEYFNKKYNKNITVEMYNMKQQDKLSKLNCFEKPEKVMELILYFIDQKGKTHLNDLLFTKK
jgi:hypothetical protein